MLPPSPVRLRCVIYDGDVSRMSQLEVILEGGVNCELFLARGSNDSLQQ
jgi:hypothetical protein